MGESQAILVKVQKPLDLLLSTLSAILVKVQKPLDRSPLALHIFGGISSYPG
jgi:hypothetical protein